MTEFFKFFSIVLLLLTGVSISIFFIVKKKYVIKIFLLIIFIFLDFKFYIFLRENPYLVKKTILIEEFTNLNCTDIDSLNSGDLSFYKGDSILFPFFAVLNNAKPINSDQGVHGDRKFNISLYYTKYKFDIYYYSNTTNYGNVILVNVNKFGFQVFQIDEDFEIIFNKIIEQDSIRKLNNELN